MSNNNNDEIQRQANEDRRKYLIEHGYPGYVKEEDAQAAEKKKKKK